MSTTKEGLLIELANLIRTEHYVEKMLERATNVPEDPREAAYLWNQAIECRDHARILDRHRRKLDRQVAKIGYPHWRRGKGPQPEEALEAARRLTSSLAFDYQKSEEAALDPYLRKFLAILAEEHRNRSMEIRGIAAGDGIFDEVEALG